MRSDILRPTGIKFGAKVWPVDRGYNLVAEDYDRWYWQPFWHANETPLVVQELGDRVNRQTALDVGTGTGQYLRVLQNLGYLTSGLDLSRQMLRMARRHLGSDANLVQGAVETAPFETGAFDVVVACRVLSHVERLDEALRELARVTKLGGRLLITDVSPTHNYVTTRIPTRVGDVHIATFKHDLADVLRNASGLGTWRTEIMEDVRFCDLVAPPDPVAYPSIDTSSRSPIFFYSVLQRT